MEDAGTERTADAAGHESRAGLGLRLALALGATALAGIVLERLLVGVMPLPAMRYMASSLVATGLVGLALYRLVVSPLAESRADRCRPKNAGAQGARAGSHTGRRSTESVALGKTGSFW